MLVLAGCGSGAVAGPRPAGPLAAAESLYLELRDARDRMDVARSAARDTASSGTPVTFLATRHHELRRALIERIEMVDSTTLSAEDRRALSTMRPALGRELAPVSGAAGPAQPAARRPDCDYEAAAVARGAGGADSLRARIYACYAWTQHRVAVGDDTLDRLSIYGELAREADRERRRGL